MQANLKLVNIGQKIGEEYWEFNSGVVTEIRGRTATGKSRILKSCALVLSLPITSEDIRVSAISFGIAKANNAKCSPLLNSSKDEAVIELQYDGILKTVELERDGTENFNSHGNQKFIYCSMLTETSKIHTSIDQGKSDFLWIVTEMSLAKDYEAIQEIVRSYKELLSSKKEEIEKKEVEKKKNQDLLKKRDEELNKIKIEIDKIEKEINAIEIDPRLKTDREKIINDLDTQKKRQDEEDNKYKNIQRELAEVVKGIENANSIIKKSTNRVGELKDEKKELEEIDNFSINKDNERILKENGELRESRGKFKEKINNLKEKIIELNEIHIKLLETEEERVLCWTCNEGYILKPDFEQRLGEKKNEKEDSEKEFNNLSKKINSNNEKHRQNQEEKDKKNMIPGIEKEYNELSKSIGALGGEKNKLEARRKEIKGEVPMYYENIESRAKKILQMEKQLKIIEDKLKKNKQVKPKLEEKNKLTRKLGGLEKEITDLEDNINNIANIEMFDFKINMSKANSIINNLGTVISGIDNHLATNIKEQREGAALKFNENIKKIIKELNFSEFKEISLDLENYNLNIIRKDNTYQPLNSLSSGEKVVVSSLLQISAKETYNREIPFIVGDDIILKMDDARREVFENYLKTIAKENDWFIILTRITDEDLIKEEI